LKEKNINTLTIPFFRKYKYTFSAAHPEEKASKDNEGFSSINWRHKIQTAN